MSRFWKTVRVLLELGICTAVYFESGPWTALAAGLSCLVAELADARFSNIERALRIRQLEGSLVGAGGAEALRVSHRDTPSP